MIDLDLARKKAESWAIEVGKLLLEERTKFHIVAHKDTQDIVTSADLKSEELLISSIKESYPDHAVFSEEEGHIEGTSDYRWVIDPLDGTKEYSRGLSNFAVTMALEYEDELVLAVVNNVIADELLSGSIDGGVFLNKDPIRPSNVKSLNQAFVYCYLPTKDVPQLSFDRTWTQLGRVARHSYRLRSHSNFNVACGWVAMGGCEAYIRPGKPEIKWWDVAPGIFLAQEAGLSVTDMDGGRVGEKSTSRGVLVASREIHSQLLALLK